MLGGFRLRILPEREVQPIRRDGAVRNLDGFQMFRVGKVFRDAVVLIELVAAVAKGVDLQVLLIQRRYRQRGRCRWEQMPSAEEDHHFIQFAGQVMPAGGNDLGVIILGTAEPDHPHLFRQIDIAPGSILIDNRCDHDAFADHQLVFDLFCGRVVLIDKGERLHIHVVIERGFDIFAVQVGQEGIPQPDNIANRLQVLEEIQLLKPCILG